MTKSGLTRAQELGTKSIGSLLAQYALPSIIAMTASSLYNMVDSIFIGQGVGHLAISGLAVTFPFMNLSTAFGTLVGVGAATLISVSLGQKDYDTAKKVLGNVVTLNILIGIGFTILSLIFLDPVLYFFGASADTIPYARDYMLIILLGNIITHLYFGLNAVLRASGHPREAMIATINTVVINTILDPIFIFGFGWGIRGAAIATILAQTISLVWQLRIFSNPNEILHFSKGIYKLKADLVKRSIAIGLSPFLMNLASCLIVIFINKGLKFHGGDLAIGAFGIANRIAFIFAMIVMGLNQGMQPIAGFNFGARQYHRVNQVLRLTIFYATIVMTVAFVVGVFFPHIVVRIFTSHDELIQISAHALRITVIVFPIVGFQMVTSNFFQSIGMAKKAIFLSLTRQLLFLLPCLIILPRFFQTDGVWWSMPVSDLLASIIAGIMLYQQFQEFKRKGNKEIMA
ncbi:MAG: MATE family efflux transporter [Phocaeicola sp.]|nr:MATE family efflux transporter [Phocaeicola sp.]